MQKIQLDHWIHSEHSERYQIPKIFVIGCADLSQYMLAVEYKHRIETIKQGEDPIHYNSLEQVKEALYRLGIHKAYLRLHNAYDECGSESACGYSDIELALPKLH
ncbi:hypothetical protein HGP28_04975 [Vibrio sp. SM6]|uniref:Uncharacterized protein n=1 Tax=Vibrio agarilyticus TaxID=2726741 RepID=A0A7X8YFT6_9VIBR|nr:DUF6482 family protein [Vibrio agarilyticus]NLS12248.1 hypothetical protein [Vibrio agarilyticus]